MIRLLRRLFGKHQAVAAPESGARENALRNAERASALAELIRESPTDRRRRELILRLESRARRR